MSSRTEIDLRSAINAISDVVQNRPRPIRVFDQIYMKSGDMVLQSELVARWSDGKNLAFIGDGDSISVCVAYLMARGIIESGPKQIVVFDFDERICRAIERFAEKERLENLSAHLYNCLDAFPRVGGFDCFYTNPPWGQSNEGESIKVFTQRGMEAVGYAGSGMIVIADDHELAWPQEVLGQVQQFALQSGFFIQRMMSRLHSYHLDDAPDLKSCNLIVRALPGNSGRGESEAIRNPERLTNFYGRDNVPKVRYVREKKRLDYGNAHDDEYSYELLEP
jgi:predicted methyltransferase